MKILHTISGLGIKAGGPTTCLYNLVFGLRSDKINTSILTFSPHHKGDRLISEEDFIHHITPPKFKKFKYSLKFKHWLKNNRQYDLIHVNGIWQYPSHASIRHCAKQKIPCILSTHGMLYPEGLKRKAGIKKLMYKLFLKKDLHLINCIHATSEKEMEFIKNLNIKTPVAVIPNAIITEYKKLNIKSQKKRVGFIGRFAPIKNIENLLKAWAKTDTSNSELVLIGEGNDDYTNALKKLISDLNISNVLFAGFVVGEEKEQLMQSLSYLVLPSKSENFGMVVAEALCREIPVIASKGTPWASLKKYDAGWWVDNSVDSLASTLNEAISLPEPARLKMGINGKNYVDENFSSGAIAQKMKQLYEWVLYKTDKPEFVYLD